ncbi:hypothetical protein KIN20_018039 [Parelaphostrongylus tenuis]|uniref:Cationic amino acid transporter C-terminal domain-containing protein n=1 Tax=Parelaphostrongylus tenuis TaxID=148309 RepID=A0AAD5MIV5_PARTN|nr:hypothetical protein KIN20_018039 [Parelaphostrongylus tenuis]
MDEYILEKMPVMAKSVSQYNSMAPVMNSSNIHNCVVDSCSIRDSEDENHGHVHLYSRELPDLPYVERFNARRPLTPTDSNQEYKYVSSSVLLSLFFSVMIFSVILGIQLMTNDYLPRRQAKVPAFPYLSYVTLFMLLFALASTKLLIFALYLAWLFIGLLLYFIYGFWNSSVRHSSQRRSSVDDDDSETYRAIIGEDYTTQLE